MNAQIKDQNCKHNGLQSCELLSNDRRAVDKGSIKMGLRDASNKSVRKCGSLKYFGGWSKSPGGGRCKEGASVMYSFLIYENSVFSLVHYA